MNLYNGHALCSDPQVRTISPDVLFSEGQDITRAFFEPWWVGLVLVLPRFILKVIKRRKITFPVLLYQLEDLLSGLSG
ncbi:MAG: hypothetical protein ACFFBD_13290 [Candidatus Hodarchaeota archaeon]